MIIDFRLRPPVNPFTSMKVYGAIAAYDAELGEEPDPAGINRDVNLMFARMKELDIVHGVFGGRMVPDPAYCTNNDDIAEVVKTYPGKFTGFAGIDHRDIKKAIAESERSVKQLGLKGINVDLGYFQDPPVYFNDSRLYPLWDYCQSENIPVMSTVSIRVGRDMTYCHPLPIDHVARDFPNLKIILAHGCWPWVAEVCGMCYFRQNVYLIPDFYGIRFPGHMQYVEAANTYLQDRMLFATAFPMRNMKIMVEGHKALPFREDVVEKYFYKNAARLLGLSS